MADTPTAEPASIRAGDTLAWRRTLPDYPAGDGWELSYRLIGPAARIDIVASADGDDHLVQVPAVTTAAYPPGDYTWLAYVTRSADRYTIGQGATRVLPDLAAAAGPQDGRSAAQKALDDLRAAMVQWLATSGHVQDYTIAGRSMRFASAAEIQQRIALAEREVARESAALGLAAAAGPRRIAVRF